MKKLLLILMLCGAVSGTLPNGTSKYFTIIYDNTKFYSVVDSMLYQIDLSDSIAKVHATIDSPDDVVVYNNRLGVNAKSYCNYDSVSGIFRVDWMAPTRTTGFDTFYICLSRSFTSAKEKTTYSGSGYSSMWIFDTTTAAATINDVSSTYVLTKAGTAAIDTGYMGNTSTHAGNTGKMYAGNQIVGTGNITFDMIVNIKSDGASGTGTLLSNGRFVLYIVDAGPSYMLLMSDGGTAANLGVIPRDQWVHLVVTRTSAGAATMYINGIRIAAPQNTGTPSNGINVLNIGSNNAQNNTLEGKIDNIGLSNTILDTNTIKNRYRILFNQTLFTVDSLKTVTPIVTISNITPNIIVLKGNYLSDWGKLVIYGNDTIAPSSETDSTIVFNCLPLTTLKNLYVVDGLISRRYSLSVNYSNSTMRVVFK
jgi:hypothetical protein